MSEHERSITVDDLRNKARRIEDMVRAGAKRVAEHDATKIAVIAAVAIAAAIAAAYFAGSRRRCA